MVDSLSWAILSSLFAWTTLYNIICLINPERSYEWNCRIVTFIHAIVLVTLSAIFGFLYNPWPFTHPGGKTSIYENLTMVLCVGYFIFDLFWCVYFFDNDTIFMIFHHFVTIIGIFGSLYTQHSGTEVNAAIFGSEMSNPMLQIRWFMRQTGKKRGVVYEINDFFFMMTFLFCRMVVGTYLMYCELSHPVPMIFFKVGAVALWLVSFVFAVQIVNFAIFKYTKMYRSWKRKNAVVIPSKLKVGECENHSEDTIEKIENGVTNTVKCNGSNPDLHNEEVITGTRKRFIHNGIHADQLE